MGIIFSKIWKVMYYFRTGNVISKTQSMKPRLIFSIFCTIAIPYMACTKKENAAPLATQTATVKVDSVMPSKAVAAHTSAYPVTFSYTGNYIEYNYGGSPQDTTLRGTSTVSVVYETVDSFLIIAPSIGASHANMFYPANVYVGFKVNLANSYTFQVRWYDDRTDQYTCSFSGDTLKCIINQSTGCYGIDGEYDGTYTGIRK